MRVSRVLRGGRATGATALAFPTIEVTQPVAPEPSVTDGAARTDGADAAHGDTAAAATTQDAPSAMPAIDEAVLETIRLEAAARGYEDGYAAGRDEAMRDVRERCAALLDRLDAAVRQVEAQRQRSFDVLSRDVATFAFSTVEALLDRELQLAASPVRESIERALRVAPDRVHAVIRVSPGDLDELGSIDELMAGRTAELVADAAVEPGGCVVHIDDCEIDAQLGGALARLRSVLQLPTEEQR
ncbi:MAG TPA: FliH/SctL family protein [Acidimicrobiales bacterium]